MTSYKFLKDFDYGSVSDVKHAIAGNTARDIDAPDWMIAIWIEKGWVEVIP